MGAQQSQYIGRSAKAHTSSASRTFTCFPRLPPEIRLEIWRLVPKPRIIELAGDSEAWEDSPIITNPPPITFSICRESRAEAMRYYQKLEFKPFREPEFGDEVTTTICIDCNRDTLYFGPGTLQTYWKTILDDPFLKEHLKYLAITCSNWPRHHPTDIALRQLKALEEVRYICDWGSPDARNSDDIAFVGIEQIARERELLEEFAAAKNAHPEWNVPMVKTGVLERKGQKPQYCYALNWFTTTMAGTHEEFYA